MVLPPVPRSLAAEVCAAMGMAIPGDDADVAALYRAWSAHLPFDPVAKAEAVRAGRRPPGDDPVEVAERWLATGLGSTCWGHCTVLAAVLDHAGVRAELAVERMLRDDIVDFHSFLVADLDQGRCLLDLVHVSGSPLPFVAGAEGDHPAYGVRLAADPGSGRLLHHVERPVTDPFHYVVVATGLDAADARAFLAISAEHSGVGRTFFQRRVLADRILRFRPADDGAALTETTIHADGSETDRTIADVDEALAAAGYRPAARAHLEAAGLLGPSW